MIDLDLLPTLVETAPVKWNQKSFKLNLTPKAKMFLAFVKDYELRNTSGPSFEEINTRFNPKKRRGHAETQLVLNRLVDAGHLRFHYRRYRTVHGQ
jgi:hypothetical protein